MSIEKVTEALKTFFSQSRGNQVIILLLAVIGWTFYDKYYIPDPNESLMRELQNEVQACKLIYRQNIELEKENNSIKAEYIILKSSTKELPFSYWIKNNNGVMRYINKVYEKKYLRPIGKRASDYIGNTDFDVWPEDVAISFMKNDSIVLASDRPMTFKEDVGNGRTIYVTKFPIKVAGEIFGIAGVEYEIFNNKIVINETD